MPVAKLMEMYEIIFQELIDQHQFETALILVKEALQPSGLYEDYPERCMKLEYRAKRKSLDQSEVLDNTMTKQ